MALTSRPIVLTTRALGSYSGVSRVAPDVLLALSRCTSDLRVRAWVPAQIAPSVDGHALGQYRLQPLPLGLVARAVLSGDAPPRSLLEHARLAALAVLGREHERAAAQPALGRELERSAQRPALGRESAAGRQASLEIVNGVAAHGLYQRVQADARRAGSVSALIVHESPRHFEHAGPTAIADVCVALRSYDYRVFVSDRGRNEWNALASLERQRSLYIPNCVHEQRVASVRARDRARLRRELGYPDAGVRLVCLGQVTVRKGQDLVLEALRALGATDRPLSVDFLGRVSDAWAERLVASSKGTPLASRVRFLGGVDDAYERIYAADALVLASRAEAFPLSVLEAMALGTCVVASDVDGVAEQLVHAQTGLLFGREDGAALAACLSQVASDPPLRAALAEAGRARYLGEFTRAHQLGRWAAAVTQMLAGGAR
jgi:glycosyltransferase involved in cell wall biosynthesis